MATATTRRTREEISREQDSLLKLRFKFAKWLDTQMDNCWLQYVDMRANLRHEIVAECKAEIEAFRDAKEVFLRLVDEELRGTVRGMG